MVGKTHMKPDMAGMARLGIDPVSAVGLQLKHTGFEPFEHDDGLHPTPSFDPDMAYNRYLRELGSPTIPGMISPIRRPAPMAECSPVVDAP